MATLYWIHLPSHQIVSNEGYVGVTIWTPQRRLYQLQRRHPDVFKHPDVHIDILFQGPRSTCWALEKSLRPDFNVGWNKFIGGKQGGTGYNFGPKPEDRKKLQSRKMRRLWSIPAFHKRITALHNKPVTKARFIKSMKALWANPEFRNRMSIALRKTPEQKAAISKAGKSRWRDPEYRAMMSAAMKGKVGAAPKSEEHKAKLRAAALARYANPSEKERTSRAVKKALRKR